MNEVDVRQALAHTVKRGFHPTQRTQRTQRTQENYATNVADVVGGTAVLIIIHNPLRYSVVCFCNLIWNLTRMWLATAEDRTRDQNRYWN